MLMKKNLKKNLHTLNSVENGSGFRGVNLPKVVRYGQESSK